MREVVNAMTKRRLPDGRCQILLRWQPTEAPALTARFDSAKPYSRDFSQFIIACAEAAAARKTVTEPELLEAIRQLLKQSTEDSQTSGAIPAGIEGLSLDFFETL